VLNKKLFSERTMFFLAAIAAKIVAGMTHIGADMAGGGLVPASPKLFGYGDR
jgi:hypothetical protein